MLQLQVQGFHTRETPRTGIFNLFCTDRVSLLQRHLLPAINGWLSEKISFIHDMDATKKFGSVSKPGETDACILCTFVSLVIRDIDDNALGDPLHSPPLTMERALLRASSAFCAAINALLSYSSKSLSAISITSGRSRPIVLVDCTWSANRTRLVIVLGCL
mmetsp:Transcript_27876/g.73535  ORF Transcript_27876/g.73535 Transcript_27876/m.73535 type:complete len:161 (+) Transcript_27876:880-1362(+)